MTPVNARDIGRYLALSAGITAVYYLLGRLGLLMVLPPYQLSPMYPAAGWGLAVLLVSADDQGHVPVFAVDAAQGAVTRLTAATSGGSHTDVAVLDAERIACIRSTLLHPPEVHVLPARAGATPRSRARHRRPRAAESG